MKKGTILFVFSIVGLFVQCGGSEPAPLPPGTVTLVAPANNEPCLDGTAISNSQSSVDFQWTVASNAQNYNLLITNLENNQTQTFQSNITNKSVTLGIGTPYRWLVKAIGAPETLPSESQSWKFYLASEGVVNYAPFPPELLTPESGSTATVVDGVIQLSWEASDVDNDLDHFEVRMDTDNGSTLVTELNYQATTTNTEVSAQQNQTYYWEIVAVDSNGNTSKSGVYSFRTQ